jgi:hypothetical protein
MRRLLLLCATVLSAAAASSLATSAEAQPRDTGAAATALFLQGREAIDRGDYVTARAKLEESLELDPSAAGTLINLALCDEKTGRLAHAWQDLRHALDLLSPGDSRRLAYVRDRLKAIEPMVPQLTLRLSPGAPAETRVVRAGVELGAGGLGSPLPVEPGHTEVVVTAPGYDSRRYDVEMHVGETRELTLDVGARLPPTPTGASAPAETGPWRTVGFASGAAAIVGVGLGAVMGVLAIDRNSAMNDLCTPAPARICHGDWMSVSSAGHAYATTSTVSFIAGAVLLGVGATLVLTHPKQVPTSAMTWMGRLAASGVVLSW